MTVEEDNRVDAVAFVGEYWNSDLKSRFITRFRFTRRANQWLVAAWGSCFPKDCEWGETRLHVLEDHDGEPGSLFAFATWNDEANSTHCLFALTAQSLHVTSIAIRTEFSSYHRSMEFRKDPARSEAATHDHSVERFCFMWDGSRPGWKLVQYPHPVFLVEFEFGEDGPNEMEFDATKEFARLSDETDEQLWKRLRGCTGYGMKTPLGPRRMEEWRQRARERGLNLTICVIQPNEYAVVTPEGGLFPWQIFPNYRQAVVERMLQAGIPIVFGQLDE